METRDIPKELGLFYIAFLTVPVYIKRYRFIIVKANLTTPSHQVPSNFMLAFKSLHLNLLNIVTFLTLKVVLGDHPTILKTILTIFKYKFVKVNSHTDNNIFVPTLCALSKKNLSQIIHQRFGHISITRLKIKSINGLMEGLLVNTPDLEEH